MVILPEERGEGMAAKSSVSLWIIITMQKEEGGREDWVSCSHVPHPFLAASFETQSAHTGL